MSTTKKKVIGLASSPLESLLGPPPAPEAAPQPRAVEAAPAPEPARPLKSVPQPAKKDRTRATFQMDRELLERCRDTVVALSGPPVRLTLVDFVEAAVRAEIARLEAEHNDGESFPQRDGELRIGRPIGS